MIYNILFYYILLNQCIFLLFMTCFPELMEVDIPPNTSKTQKLFLSMFVSVVMSLITTPIIVHQLLNHKE